jgi:hypothetical protein
MMMMMMIMMMFRTNFVEKIKHVLCAIHFCQSDVRDNEIEMSKDNTADPLSVYFQACYTSTYIANDMIVLCSCVSMLFRKIKKKYVINKTEICWGNFKHRIELYLEHSYVPTSLDIKVWIRWT